MKLISIIAIVLTFTSCEPVRPFYTNFVKLNATISDSSAIMHLGDTLKINLTIPDTIKASSINGGSENQIVR